MSLAYLASGVLGVPDDDDDDARLDEKILVGDYRLLQYAALSLTVYFATNLPTAPCSETHSEIARLAKFGKQTYTPNLSR